MIYQWKHGFPNRKVDPMKAGAQLEHIRRYRHIVTPEAIVEDSKRPDAALNPIFEWNNVVAGRLFRLSQARNVLQSLVIVREDAPDKPPIRAYVHLNGDEDADSRYEKIQVVMADAELRRQVLQTAWRELQGWRGRYDEYKEFAAIFAAIQETAEQLAS